MSPDFPTCHDDQNHCVNSLTFDIRRWLKKVAKVDFDLGIKGFSLIFISESPNPRYLPLKTAVPRTNYLINDALDHWVTA